MGGTSLSYDGGHVCRELTRCGREIEPPSNHWTELNPRKFNSTGTFMTLKVFDPGHTGEATATAAIIARDYHPQGQKRIRSGRPGIRSCGRRLCVLGGDSVLWEATLCCGRRLCRRLGPESRPVAVGDASHKGVSIGGIPGCPQSDPRSASRQITVGHWNSCSRRFTSSSRPLFRSSGLFFYVPVAYNAASCIGCRQAAALAGSF